MGTLSIFSIGLLAFTLSFLLFHHPRFGKLSFFEPFFLAYVCLRLLAFSRSTEEIAEISSSLTQFLMAYTVVVFLLSSCIVYICLFPLSIQKIKKEAVIFGSSALAILFLFLFLLSPNFISNMMIDNLLEGRLDRRTREVDSDWDYNESNSDRRQGRPTLPRDSNGRQPSLRGLSEYDWPLDGRRGGGSGADNQQYTVMVVASRNEPVYMGSAILGTLDPIEGFLYSQNEPFNRLSSQRFFVTWIDNELVYDMGRQSWDVFALSTLSLKYMPYRPIAIEPTIQSENTGPFRFIHNTVSNVHHGNPTDLLFRAGRDLNAREREELGAYLDVPLFEDDLEIFNEHLNRVLENWARERDTIPGIRPNPSLEIVIAILLGFSDFQYHINMNYSASISDLVNFIQNTREGDCVEFSHAAALLARMAGVPSRVVTGYLAAESLQTEAHLRGLASLRNRLPVLRQFAFNDLFLVTDAHGHAWPQFYIPGYGWLDFESTSYAIPPMGFGDGNLRDVVIPLIDDNQLFSNVRAFPWRALGFILGCIAASLLLIAYALRYGIELRYRIKTKIGGSMGARYLYLLLLLKLASEGKPIKPISKTAPEYAEMFGETNDLFKHFAEVYTEIRYRTFSDKSEEEKRFSILKNSYSEILLFYKRKGIKGLILRIFSLRALKYL